MKKIEAFFKLRENNTTVRTEVIAGITTFMTMAYIIFVNPSILSATGMDSGAIMVATCISAFIGTVLIGLLSNYPFAQAPGMGLNAFFAVTICGVMGYSWQAALAAVFLAGIIFILITLTGIREQIVNAIPNFLKKSISGGIGLFIAYIGIKNAGLLEFITDPWNVKTTLADGTVISNAGAVPKFFFASPTVILAIIGIIITIILVVKKVRGSLLLSIIATSVVGAIMQFGLGYDVGIALPTGFKIASLTPTFGQFIYGFGELFTTSNGLIATIVSLVSVLISLTLVDMFDTIGTLVGTASKAGFMDEDGNLPNISRALMADAVATTCGAVIGTSTVTTFVESSAGVAEGGRTGLTSMVTGFLFLFAVVLSPVLGLIPGSATAPILIIVGAMMMSSIKDVDWDDMAIAIPAFLTVVCMPLAYSIAEGISVGFITHIVISIFTGKAKKVHPILYIMTFLFIVRYFLIIG